MAANITISFTIAMINNITLSLFIEMAANSMMLLMQSCLQ